MLKEISRPIKNYNSIVKYSSKISQKGLFKKTWLTKNLDNNLYTINFLRNVKI